MTDHDWKIVLQGDPSPDTKLVYADWLEENGALPLANAWREYVKLEKEPYSWKGLVFGSKSSRRKTLWYWFNDRKLVRWGLLTPAEIEAYIGKNWGLCLLDDTIDQPRPAIIEKATLDLYNLMGEGICNSFPTRLKAETAIVNALLMLPGLCNCTTCLKQRKHHDS